MTGFCDPSTYVCCLQYLGSLPEILEPADNLEDIDGRLDKNDILTSLGHGISSVSFLVFAANVLALGICLCESTVESRVGIAACHKEGRGPY